MRILYLPTLCFVVLLQGCVRSPSIQFDVNDFKAGATLTSPGMSPVETKSNPLPIFISSNLIGWICSAPDEVDLFNTRPRWIGFKDKDTGKTTIIIHLNMYSEIASVVQSHNQNYIYFLWKRPAHSLIGIEYSIDTFSLQTLSVTRSKINKTTYLSLRATSRR